MKQIFIRFFALTLLAGLLSLSCTENEFPIFYYIESESEQIDNSLDNTLAITGMGKSADYYYIAAGGTMFTRQHYDNIEQWDEMELPDNASYCTAMTITHGPTPTTSDGLYAGFLMQDESYALFVGAPKRSPLWHDVDDTDVAGKQIIRLEQLTTGEAQEQLFVITLDSGSYSLYYSNDGSTFAPALQDQSEPIKNVTYDTDNGQFWAITRSKVFTFTGTQVTGQFTEKTANNPETHGGYMGVRWVGAPFNLYYISTQGGVIFSSPDGDNWTMSSAHTISDEDVPFTFFSVLPATGSAENVLVGTVGFGFFEMENGLVGSLSRLTEFTAHELYYGWVEEIFVDGDKAFFRTIGSGLWRNVYESGSWGDWVWE